MCQKFAIMKFVIILNYVVVVPMCAAQSNQLDSAIEQLNQLRSGDGAQVLDGCIASIREHMPAGDFAAWRRLRAVLENAEQPVQVQLAVLSLAAEKADERMALDMLDVVRDWIEALSQKNADRIMSDKDEWRRKTALVYRFLDLLERDLLAKHLGSHPKTLEVLRTIATDAMVDPQKGAQALELIYGSKATLAQRRAVAEAIVAVRPKAEGHHALLLKLLDRTSLPKLRELVRQSEDPHKFHYGAASALAHLGDVEIRDELKRLSAKFTPIERNLGGILEYFVWQIEVQQTPDKLLGYIASDQHVGSSRRCWAVRRAVELGVEREKIRAAILEHAANVEPRAHRRENGRTIKFWPGLSTLKKEGLKLGILLPNDLPDVKVPQVEPTP